MRNTGMKNHQTLNFLAILAVASLFVKISGSSSPRPVLTGPSLAYLGSRVVFRCTAPDAAPPVTYELVTDEGALIGRYEDFQGGQPASLVMKVSAASNGSYHCRATAGGQTGVSNSIKLSVITPASQTTVTSDPSPPVVYEGLGLVLSCEVAKGSHLSYTWFFNRKEVTPSTSDAFHIAGNKLVMETVTPQEAGDYYCMAWSSVQNIRRFSSSSELQVTVKVHVSEPKISFSVFKQGGSYHGNVSCWASRGSLPVNFTLTVDDKAVDSVTVTESLAAWFHVDVVPGLDMGVARCRVSTEVQDLLSEPVTLEVVPVGKEIKVDVEYLYTTESILAAAVLTCRVGRGTFPHISWLYNGAPIPAGSREESHLRHVTPRFALVEERRTLVVTELSPEVTGYYRCRARDSYDEAGPWAESEAELLQLTEFRMTTTETITIFFCCFCLLMLAVCAVCGFTMLDQKQAHPQTAHANLDAFSLPEQTTDLTYTDHRVQSQKYK